MKKTTKGFHRIKGFASIPDVVKQIEAGEAFTQSQKTLKKAA